MMPWVGFVSIQTRHSADLSSTEAQRRATQHNLSLSEESLEEYRSL